MHRCRPFAFHCRFPLLWINRFITMRKNDLPPPVPAARSVTGMIAIVGCDGCGKSTLTADLVSRMNLQRATTRCYLGLISGEQGDKIKRLPLIGPWLERRLAAKSEKTQSMRSRSPPLWAALVMYGLSCWRARNLRKAQRLAASGVLVIGDRYPQAEVAGFHYDGPGIGPERANGWLITRLARKEQQLYRQMALLRPQLIIRLAIDVDTAFSRKPDHSYSELGDKIAVMTRLNYNGARIVDLDSRAPYPQVFSAALAALSGVAVAGEESANCDHSLFSNNR